MKLEIGMFYRYKGQIGKYKKITELDRYPSFTNNYLKVADNILLNNAEFSYDILELIEKDDYVNGKKVYSIGLTIGILNTINFTDGTFMAADDIKSIVTKEQFEQMAYKVGE